MLRPSQVSSDGAAGPRAFLIAISSLNTKNEGMAPIRELTLGEVNAALSQVDRPGKITIVKAGDFAKAGTAAPIKERFKASINDERREQSRRSSLWRHQYSRSCGWFIPFLGTSGTP
jgi:hypothetical protein